MIQGDTRSLDYGSYISAKGRLGFPLQDPFLAMDKKDVYVLVTSPGVSYLEDQGGLVVK